MAKDTAIEWCDSVCNLQMGCDGCELWNRKAGVLHCYAGTLTDRYGGTNRGFPVKFERPRLFPERLDPALKWSDLTGKERQEKPWLNGLPRVIFLNDMGDTFTESLERDWLAPFLPRLAASPHIYMLLTKRGKRLREFSEAHPLPANVWPGVSVTTAETLPRVQELHGVRGGGVRWVSVEPLLGPLSLKPHLQFPPFSDGYKMTLGLSEFRGVELVIAGGESGPEARRCELEWVRRLRHECQSAGVPFFLKQLGAAASDPVNGIAGRSLVVPEEATGLISLRLRDSKGGNMEEWPADLRVREMPKLALAS